MKKELKLNLERVKSLKEIIKEENSIWINSDFYGGRRFGFKISKEWAKKNKWCMIKDNQSRMLIAEYFRAIVEFNPIKNFFLEKYCYTYEHAELIRNSCYEFYDQTELKGKVDFSHDTIGYIMLDYKRPFGNKDYVNDVLSFLGYNSYDDGLPNEEAIKKMIEEVFDCVFKYWIEEDLDETLHVRTKTGYWILERVPKKESFLKKIRRLIWF